MVYFAQVFLGLSTCSDGVKAAWLVQHGGLLMHISVKCSWQNLQSSTKTWKNLFQNGWVFGLTHVRPSCVDTCEAKADLQESHRIWKDSFEIGQSIDSFVCLKLLHLTWMQSGKDCKQNLKHLNYVESCFKIHLCLLTPLGVFLGTNCWHASLILTLQLPLYVLMAGAMRILGWLAGDAGCWATWSFWGTWVFWAQDSSTNTWTFELCCCKSLFDLIGAQVISQ